VGRKAKFPPCPRSGRLHTGTRRGCQCPRCDYYRKLARECAAKRKAGRDAMAEHLAKLEKAGGVVRSAPPREVVEYVRDRHGHKRRAYPPVPHYWRRIGIVA